MAEKLAILDCGGQYTKVIDRKVRELGVKSEILPLSAGAEALEEYNAIILSGGPSSVYDKDAPAYNDEIFGLGKPVLGICYGFHLINRHFGGEVKPGIKNEYGQAIINIDTSCALFDGLDNTETVLMSHGDSAASIAPGFVQVADTDGVTAAIYNESKRIAGVQFHPEVELTHNGIVILKNFLRNICGFKEEYALEDRVQTAIDMIRAKVGDNKVIILVSGGVDSMVSAALLKRALKPEQIYAIHIDHGFMRLNEGDAICETLEKIGFNKLLRINAKDDFYYKKAEIEDGVIAGPITEVTEPEDKRRIIGRIFIDVTREAAQSLGLDFDKTFIAQGTLRPDLIESGNPDVSVYAKKIKTHHNDVDIIRQAREKGLIVETNWDWHKDEVRAVARMLGLGEEIASRQPFPGPGLAVRMICHDGKETALPEGASLLTEYLQQSGFGIEAHIAPVYSVGVQGDLRSYKNLAILQGGGLQCDMKNLAAIAADIPNKVNFINRCAYILNKSHLNGELKCFKTNMNEENIELLRQVDAIVTSEIDGTKISQCFAVLIPVYSGNEVKYSAAIRAVITSDYMTARSAIPGIDIPLATFERIVDRIEKLSQIDMILYDLSCKPPATIEWE